MSVTPYPLWCLYFLTSCKRTPPISRHNAWSQGCPLTGGLTVLGVNVILLTWQGERGTDGQDGTPGTKGEKGQQGMKGEPGQITQGPKGIDGPKGDRGETGAPGKDGPKGSKGTVRPQLFRPRFSRFLTLWS